MSPSQRATVGRRAAEAAPSRSRVVERAASAWSRSTSSPRSATPVPSASPPPRTRRQRRSRSSSVDRPGRSGAVVGAPSASPAAAARPGCGRGSACTRSARASSRPPPIGRGRGARGVRARDPLADRAPLRRRRTSRTSGAAAAGRCRRRPPGSRDPAVERRRTARRRGAGACRCRGGSPRPSAAPAAGSAPSESARRIRRVGLVGRRAPRRRAGAGRRARRPGRAGRAGPASAAQRRAPRAPVLGVVEQGDRAVDAVDRAREHRARRVVVERRRGGRQADADARDEPVDDAGDGRRVGPADVAVAEDAGQRRQRVHQVRRRRAPTAATSPMRATTCSTASGRSASSTCSTQRRQRGQRRPPRRPGRGSARSRPRRSVLPQRLASIRATANSGCHCEPPELVERAALAARRARASPQGTPSSAEPVQQVARGRGRSARAGRGRRPSGRPRASSAAAAARARGRLRAARSGASGGTSPSRRADDQPLADEAQRQVRRRSRGPARSPRSARPAPGSDRPRSAASVSASRTASMRCADEASRPSARKTGATCAIHDTASGSLPDQRCSYQPGDSTPAP